MYVYIFQFFHFKHTVTQLLPTHIQYIMFNNVDICIGAQYKFITNSCIFVFIPKLYTSEKEILLARVVEAYGGVALQSIYCFPRY